MFRSILSAAVVVAGLGVSAAQGAVTWDWRYDANVTPDVSGSVTKDDGTPWSAFTPYIGVPNVSSTASGGLYTASTLVSGGGGSGGWQYPVGPGNMAYFNNTTGYTVEWRMRVNSIDAEEAGYGSLVMEMEDGSNVVNQYFSLGYDNVGGQYKVALYGADLNNGVIANINAGDFNIYRVTVLNGVATLYMNGNPTPVGTVTDPRTDINYNTLQFSDATGLNDSNYTVDYLYATGQGAFAPEAVPEPACLGLLAMGGLAMVRRRRV